MATATDLAVLRGLSTYKARVGPNFFSLGHAYSLYVGHPRKTARSEAVAIFYEIIYLPMAVVQGLPEKKGGGGGGARGHSTVRGAPQNGDGRVEADFAIMLSRITKFVFFSNVAPKILEKAEIAQKKERPEVAWLP